MMEDTENLLATMAYHTLLRDLLMSMDVPGRERTIGNIGENKTPQMIFAEGEEGPVTSITLPSKLLFALANSTNLRLLIEDEIIKCAEDAEKEGLDIHVPDAGARKSPADMSEAEFNEYLGAKQ